ncbi:hypothetical protein FQN49_007241 [Arthroderma sp. PD_2]|nr:hypothetical protein FQN49_007241 [Arthroderma sp. PD_2]
MSLEDESKTMQDVEAQVQAPNLPPGDTAGGPTAVPDPTPNGGRDAWMQVTGAFVLTQNTWGLVMAHGAFQASYATGILSTSSLSALSWIGSIQAFLILFIGIFSCRAVDAGYFPLVAGTGLFFQILGLIMTSLSTKYYQFLLAEGLCVGIGSGFLFAPGITIAASYFTTKRPLAIAMATSGAAVGGILFPIVSYWLVVDVGFAWAIRIITLLVLLTSGFTIYTLRPKASLPAARRVIPLIDFAGFKDPAYLTFVIGTTLGLVACFIPFFYNPVYAIGLGLRSELASYLLSSMNVASLMGGFLLVIFAVRVGTLNAIIPFTYVSGVILLLLLVNQNLAGLVVASLLYAFVSGYQLILVATTIASISSDTNEICGQVRTAIALGSIGALIGTPIAGSILSRQNRHIPVEDLANWSFTWALIFTGVILLICGAVWTTTRVLKKGMKWEKI